MSIPKIPTFQEIVRMLPPRLQEAAVKNAQAVLAKNPISRVLETIVFLGGALVAIASYQLPKRISTTGPYSIYGKAVGIVLMSLSMLRFISKTNAIGQIYQTEQKTKLDPFLSNLLFDKETFPLRYSGEYCIYQEKGPFVINNEQGANEFINNHNLKRQTIETLGARIKAISPEAIRSNLNQYKDTLTKIFGQNCVDILPILFQDNLKGLPNWDELKRPVSIGVCLKDQERPGYYIIMKLRNPLTNAKGTYGFIAIKHKDKDGHEWQYISEGANFTSQVPFKADGSYNEAYDAPLRLVKALLKIGKTNDSGNNAWELVRTK